MLNTHYTWFSTVVLVLPQEEFNTAIKNGVVKVNLDTDCQYAYLTGIRDYVTNKIEYLKAPVGNPEGADKPNKNTLTQESGLRR